MDNLIAQIHQSPKTVFTTKVLAMIWREGNKNNLKGKTAYYVKQGNLIRLTRGIFAKKKDYDPRELAISIYSPAYISFETVLRDKGIIFQHYDSLFIAGPWSKKIIINKQVFVFRKLKDTILFDSTGVSSKKEYSIASTERAFLDTIYLFPNYYFDNLRSINWEKCFELVKIYNNKQLVKRLNKYHKNYA